MAGPGRWRSPDSQGGGSLDYTGYWVSQIVDEWRFRVDPQKGTCRTYPSMPRPARWRIPGPGEDEAEGNQCKAYDAVGVMQRPGRLHITWVDDNTLQIDPMRARRLAWCTWRHSKQNPRARLAGKVFASDMGRTTRRTRSSRSPAARRQYFKSGHH